jgi:hypothetical protein
VTFQKTDLPARRGRARFLASLPAVVRVDGEDHSCAADDLSRTGVLLTGTFACPTDPMVEVTITTAAKDRTLHLEGRVMHAHENEEAGELRLGVQFEHLTDEQNETIDLLVSRVVEGMAPAALEGIDKKASVGEIREALSKVTVAHRVQLAARCGPKERAILKHDPDPHVLESLARNPNINLPEIKTLLRRTDLLPSTLEVVASDVRWFADDETKIMVATHPRVTFTTADKVVHRMNELTVARVIQRPGLQPGVKQKLMVKMSRKHRGPN